MTRHYGIVTDSNSQITSSLVERYEVLVVPLTVTIDNVDFEEGVDLDADGFYRHFDGERTPEVSTSQPSPGRFLDAYRELEARGCDEIWSIHMSSAMSGTVDSATIAAREVAAIVHIIDTNTASFGVAACVWAAGQALESGADADSVSSRVAQLVEQMGTVFMIGVPHLTERGGRAPDLELGGDGVLVLAMSRGDLEVLGRVDTIDDTIELMEQYTATWTREHGGGVTVAIGDSDEASRPLADRLTARLTPMSGVDEIVQYRVGPSVGAHTGPGTFGLFVFPTINLN
jgi:DegV family protein with EDD domain